MDYIHTLLLMEDDLDEDDDVMGEFWDVAGESTSSDQQLRQQCSQEPTPNPPDQPDLQNSPPIDVPDLCVCGNCRLMPHEVKNKCCLQKKCITLLSRLTKLCLHPDILELCIRNTSDIRNDLQNDQKDNRARAFRKAAYRQFILARHGHPGKGNRKVCPSCVVIKLRARYPSLTGVYMGYREH